jgi:hypothetical protein
LSGWDGLFTDIERRLLAEEVFLVRNGKASFFISALDERRGLLRYDPGCMVPTRRRAIEAAQLISDRVARAARPHHWTSDDLLVIDNWRTMHARPGVPNGVERRLSRVMVAT